MKYQGFNTYAHKCNKTTYLFHNKTIISDVYCGFAMAQGWLGTKRRHAINCANVDQVLLLNHWEDCTSTYHW